MKWAYIIGGTLGGVIMAALILYETFTYFDAVAKSTQSARLDMDILVTLGLGWSLTIVPVGVGIGLILVGAVHLIILNRRTGARPFDPTQKVHSWVSKRRKAS